MTVPQEFASTIYDGWRNYQQSMIEAISPLTAEQLDLNISSDLRSVHDIAVHIIGARARWFYLLMDEGGPLFQQLGKWDAREAPKRSAAELITGLGQTWQGMHEAIGRWTEEQWQQTWPGEGGDGPEILTRQWVIWHLIEHDVHHGGEISFILGAHGIRALQL